MISKDSKIYIAGHNGMVGSACWKALSNKGYYNLVGKSSKDLDLRNQSDVKDFLLEEKPHIIIDCAAKVGGIMANNTYPYEFLIENMQIQNNLIDSAHALDIPKFIFLGSSCIYPKYSNQPIKENYLLTGELEPTNQWYALAKISGIKLISALRKQYNRDYVSLMPTNLYGPKDNFDLNTSHVIPALIRKFHDAKISGDKNVTLWGTGKPMREFLHVNDLANAIVFAVENNLSNPFYNIGCGKDISIENLAKIMEEIIEYKGEITWDTEKPDGTPRKLLDVSEINKLGWKYSIGLREGISQTYKWYISEIL